MSNLRRSIRSHIRFALHIHLACAVRYKHNCRRRIIPSTLDSNSFIEWWWCYKWGSIVAFSKSHDIMRRRQREREKSWMLCCTFYYVRLITAFYTFASEWMEKCTLESLLAGITRKGIFFSFRVHLLIITSRRCHVEFLVGELGNAWTLQSSPFTVKCCVLWMHKAKNFISYHFSTLFFRFASMSSELLSKRSLLWMYWVREA